MIGLNSERQRNLYDSGQYLEHSPDWSEQEAADKAKTALALFARAGLSNVKSILDVGCGAGGVLAGIVDKMPPGTTGLGIDTAPNAIRIGKALRGVDSKVELQVADLSQISGPFDLVMACHVVEHVDDYGAFLDELAMRSSTLYINIPIEINVLYALRRNSHREVYRKYGHVNFFTESYFDDFVKSRGFTIAAKGYGTEFRSQGQRGLLGSTVHMIREFLGLFSQSFAMKMVGGFTYQVLLKKDQ